MLAVTQCNSNDGSKTYKIEEAHTGQQSARAAHWATVRATSTLDNYIGLDTTPLIVMYDEVRMKRKGLGEDWGRHTSHWVHQHY